MQVESQSTRTRAIAIGIFACYFAAWVFLNRSPLFDPMIQADDARQHLIAFSEFHENPAMADDPVIAEMVAMAPTGFYWIHRLIGSVTSPLVSAKIIQGICLLIPFVAIIVVARKRAASLPPLIFTLFFILHTPDYIRLVSSGLQRSFTLPCSFLWIAGAFAEIRAMRVAGILLGALTYPTVMALLLASEFFLVLLSALRDRQSFLRLKIFREGAILLVLVACCVALLTPYMIRSRSTVGPVVTLEEARTDPGLRRGGRMDAVPFKHLGRHTQAALTRPFEFSWRRLPNIDSTMENLRERLRPLTAGQFRVALSVVLLVVAAWLTTTGHIPVPMVGIALFLAGIVTAYSARLVAFRLYLPDRYIGFALPLASIAVLAVTIPHLRIRGFGSGFGNVAVAMVATIAILGPGIDGRLAAGLDYREDQALWEFLKATSPESRIACHPMDCDSVSLFAARASTAGRETLNPLFPESWERGKLRTRHTFEALYATDLPAVTAFCQEYQVTHFLLRKLRYGEDFRRRADSFEPFSTMTREMLEDVELSELVLAREIERHPLFSDGALVVVGCPGLSLATSPGS